MSRSAIPASLTASWTGWCTTPTVLSWMASPCESCVDGSRPKSCLPELTSLAFHSLPAGSPQAWHGFAVTRSHRSPAMLLDLPTCGPELELKTTGVGLVCSDAGYRLSPVGQGHPDFTGTKGKPRPPPAIASWRAWYHGGKKTPAQSARRSTDLLAPQPD